MYTDWKNYFRQYMPGEEYIPDNICSKSLSSFIFFVCLGIISSLGLITKFEISTEKPVDPIFSKINKIKTEIKSLELKNTLLESEILISNHNLTQIIANKEKKEVLKLSKLTTAQPVTGSGITIQLIDSDKPLSSEDNPNIGIVHNTNLLEIINDLWAGGANAISINNERISSLSEISCIGPTILVNKTRIVPPFIIKATGNQTKLEKAAENGHLQNLKLYGIKYIIKKNKFIQIPADGNIILTGEI